MIGTVFVGLIQKPCKYISTGSIVISSFTSSANGKFIWLLSVKIAVWISKRIFPLLFLQKSLFSTVLQRSTALLSRPPRHFENSFLCGPIKQSSVSFTSERKKMPPAVVPDPRINEVATGASNGPSNPSQVCQVTCLYGLFHKLIGEDALGAISRSGRTLHGNVRLNGRLIDWLINWLTTVYCSRKNYKSLKNSSLIYIFGILFDKLTCKFIHF